MSSGIINPEAPIRPAAESGMTMAFQPIVDVVEGRVYAYEAVLHGPEGETAAEIFARIVPESRGDFDRRCAAAAVRWAMAAGLGNTAARLCIPVHAPGASVPGEPMLTAVRIGRQCGLIPERMIFALHGYQDLPGAKLADIVHCNASMGSQTIFVGLGADQVGLGACARYAPNAVKLDSDLVSGIANSWSRRLVLEDLTPRVRKLGIRILAGGVDSQAVLARLRSFGIFHVQGDHVGPPEIGVLPEPILQRDAA
ncbi:EAL domain-containing protein [Sphingomonas sp. dw_22]|uniref:EAL domain-containing protein n=1 Tax=Sphingomonas sp. dw_22 TaxID=2721175 RepID=UPI001BD2CFAE|nr:EAL domain-containing protein [Sphingomonas sp. dw_22]